MYQTKKGNEWRFGMKCHVGVDAFSGLVHTIVVTPANTHDITMTTELIREDDEVVYGDSSCKFVPAGHLFITQFYLTIPRL